MKALILIVLGATSLCAQSIADVARQERARQSRLESVRIFTNEDARNAIGPNSAVLMTAPGQAAEADPSEATALEAAEGDAAADADAAGDSEDSAEAPSVSPNVPAAMTPAQSPLPAAVPDPVQAWNAEVQALRARIRQLQDEETALQLELNRITNEVFAPVTTQAARTRAQNALAGTQGRLEVTRKELSDARLMLQQMEAQGPPAR